MKKIKRAIGGLIVITLISCQSKESFLKDNFQFAEEQTQSMLNAMHDSVWYPRTSGADGKMIYTCANKWTAGFFPGILWYLYENSQDSKWENYARKWTNGLKAMQYTTRTHDVGFMMYCSYGNGYRLTGDETMKQVLIQSANSLITRYNSNVRTIKSWDGRASWDGKTYWDFPVIIDNMMNLELLYFASKVTGDSIYADIATNHATTTMKYHFRDDYSTFHVVDYDTITGLPKNRQTCQGFSDNSTWARGQAWAIYGFTMVYRETQDNRFLETAEKAANYYLDSQSLPQDKIPYWDMNVNQPGYIPDFCWNPNRFKKQPRDASAAAVIASALFELSNYSKNYERKFRQAAIEMVHTLASPEYRAPLGENNNFILMHSTGSLPHEVEIDVPLCYADYYFLEALLRYKALQ